MSNNLPLFIALAFLALYAGFVTAGLFVMWLRSLARERENLKQNLAIADNYAQDLETEKAEQAAGYSLMATSLEEHQTIIEALVAHTEEHCRQIAQLSHIRIRIVPLSEEEDTEEPYAESTSPTLPLPDIEWIEDAEGLDTL